MIKRIGKFPDNNLLERELDNIIENMPEDVQKKVTYTKGTIDKSRMGEFEDSEIRIMYDGSDFYLVVKPKDGSVSKLFKVQLTEVT